MVPKAHGCVCFARHHTESLDLIRRCDSPFLGDSDQVTQLLRVLVSHLLKNGDANSCEGVEDNSPQMCHFGTWIVCTEDNNAPKTQEGLLASPSPGASGKESTDPLADDDKQCHREPCGWRVVMVTQQCECIWRFSGKQPACQCRGLKRPGVQSLS